MELEIKLVGQWFKSYLQDRKQCMGINTPDSNSNIYSDWGVIKLEVPQG
jgi:hypothetical protein